MTSRIRTSLLRHADQADGAVPVVRIGWADVPGRLRVALFLGVAGAVLLVAGPAIGLVEDGPAAGFGALPVLAALAVVPPLLAIGFVVAKAPATGAAVLVGSAMLAPGRALVDAQFAVDPLLTSRPEILVPTVLAPLSAAPGLWLLLAGHGAMALAGLLAVGRAGAIPGTPYASEFDDHSADRSTKAQGTSLVLALIAALLAAVGLLLAPFRSDNAFVLASSVIDAPPLARFGVLLLAGAAAAGAVFGAGSARPSVARGVVLGVTAAVAGVTVPQLAAGTAVDHLHLAPGPVIALSALVALTVAVWLLNRQENPAEDRATELDTGRLHLIAGILGLASAAAALAAATSVQLVVTGGLDRPVAYSSRLFVPAAIVVLALAVPLLFARAAAATRPAFAVAVIAIPLVAASSSDAVFTAISASDAVSAGPGAWFGGIAAVLAVAAACVAALAGVVERDDVDLTERQANLTLAAPLAAAALFAIGAFGLPVLKAPGFVAPGIWSHFRPASWGLLLGVVVVLAIIAVAAFSRPPRGGALLAGAAALVAVHALEFALTSDRAEGATAGPGTWLSLACVAALLVAALIAAIARPAVKTRR
ncbi:hypothetical protein [Actinokineospora sp.]|uniref:hypothetical protein n=1 Tax=Actinokineospora sp. TaxID=1872133 RepID=UPI003D6B4F23